MLFVTLENSSYIFQNSSFSSVTEKCCFFTCPQYYLILPFLSVIIFLALLHFHSTSLKVPKNCDSSVLFVPLFSPSSKYAWLPRESSSSHWWWSGSVWPLFPPRSRRPRGSFLSCCFSTINYLHAPGCPQPTSTIMWCASPTHRPSCSTPKTRWTHTHKYTHWMAHRLCSKWTGLTPKYKHMYSVMHAFSQCYGNEWGHWL